MRGERVPCSIEGCHRSTAEEFGYWICGPHWQRLTKAERRVWARLRRKARKRGWDVDGERIARIWQALIRRATPAQPESIPHAKPTRDPTKPAKDRAIVRARRGHNPITRPRR